MFEMGDVITYATNYENYASGYEYPVLFEMSDNILSTLIQYITEVDFEYTDYVRRQIPLLSCSQTIRHKMPVYLFSVLY